MENQAIKLSITTDKVNHIVLPEEIGDPFEQIAFGTKSVSCTISLHDENEIIVSEDVADQLGIPYEGNVHLIPHENTIHIGPLIGIFTAGFTGSMLRPVGDRSLFFAKLLEVEKAVGAYSFVFGAHHIDWERGTIKGYFHTKQGWQSFDVPFPHVVYDRLPNRKTENHETLKKIKEKLSHDYLIPWFNPGFFNKWDIHQMFQKKPSLTKYLPETIKNPSIPEIKRLLQTHRHVYLKPAEGSLGLGIYQIIFVAEEDRYYCRYRKDDRNYLRKYPSLEKLIDHQHLSLSTYIVQQGISLLRLNKKQIDFRIHTNKNEHGQWEMSAMAVKVAGPGSVTTHLRSGGEIKTFDEVFENESERQQLLQEIESVVLKMSHILDQSIAGLIGEVGFDIGIDKDKQIWLFEANSKPGRSIFKHPKLKSSDQLSRKLPLSYAVYLTKQAIISPQSLFQPELKK